jgi:membrane protein YfhO
MKFRRSFIPSDAIAVVFLIALWLLFFWRLFTPIEADQSSLKMGDFSGQFVAFAGYQYQRFAAGEVPLWDPYNNGGLPFIGDTQAAVFYPPRLVTIALSKLAGGWTYHALELEMTFHVLACSVFMYLLLRRMTLGQPGSIFGAIIAAIIASYGGFLTSYPPLQLALLEAAIWLPLGVLGVYEATREEHIRWGWLALTGFALGLSWMAGHPQTSWFLTYLLMVFFAYRVYGQRYRWTTFIIGTVIFGAISAGVAAVQLLPGAEYLARTARTGLGFDAKGNGFPFQDMIQFIFPGLASVWSPLYVGIVGLVLALIAIWRKLPGYIFWGIVALVSLGLSFGSNSPVFALLYNTLPGLRFFRGQERAAYLVSFSLAILAGIGAAHLIAWDKLQDFKATRRIQQALLGLVVISAIFAGAIFVAWLGNNEAYDKFIRPAFLSTLVTLLAYFVIPRLLDHPQSVLRASLVGALLVFDLFAVSMDKSSNFDHVPPSRQLSMTPPPLVAAALADTDTPFRVDGYRGLHDNYGSLYDLADMRGISPLFLEAPFTLQQGNLINPRAWELFAVRYVYSDWAQLPVPSEIIASGTDRYGAVNLHRLTDPRPFAYLIYEARTVPNDAEALQMSSAADFNPRQTISLNQNPGITISAPRPPDASASVTEFKPEAITIHVNTPTNAILSLAHPDYPGWQAALDNQPTTLLRAYGAFTAIAVPAGQHTVTLTYDPLSYRIGSTISLIAWGGLAILGFVFAIRRMTLYARNQRAARLG